MKRIVLLLLLLAIPPRLQAQSNLPVRLAIVPETTGAGTVADVLTAEFSKNNQVHLLERAEIERVYREQGLSAANRDDLKLGRLLGADGLLLAGTSGEGTNQFLNIRLVAVKPGVVLIAERFPWPIKDLTGWAPLFVRHLRVFLPKLTVVAKDAIPISVVNLRSAMQSEEGMEEEQELKLLTIQRLSREPRLFVLERQRMQLLSQEKELKSDESVFWDGSYLLEGVVDQNGYSPTTVTINARLTPPKRGAPIQFEVSGSRTNLAEVINQLVVQVDEALKVHPIAPVWNATDEAQQYFKEAQWALKWGVYSEAQTAADSAWALGKQDLDCAIVRINAYLLEVSREVGHYQGGRSAVYSGFDANNKPSSTPPPDAQVQSLIKYLKAKHPLGKAGNIIEQPASTEHPAAKIYTFVYPDRPPDPQNIGHAFHALELYYEFSRTSPDGVPKVLNRGQGWNHWHNSEWYVLGISNLVAASRVLQSFNFVPESQKSVADKLAELRALCRLVAQLISESPSVHDSYFVGDRIVTHDELGITIGEDGGRNPNIFSCEAQWGCFWQETPEDCIALYRRLMSSPVFCYVHERLWFRPLERPRLIAWNETDQRRLAKVWDDFLREMDASTNVFMRMEGKAMVLRDASGDKAEAVAVTNFFEVLLENRCAFIANNVEVLYLNWGIDDLVRAIGGYYYDIAGGGIERTGFATPQTEALWKYCSDFSTILSAKDVECKNALAFASQEKYLKDNKPFDPNEFARMFILGFKDYSKSQALEIQPLLAAYKTNLTGIWASIGAMQVGEVEANINRILNSPTAMPQPPVQSSAPRQVAVVNVTAVSPVSNRVPATGIPGETREIATNVITIKRFLPIPLDGLPGDQISDVTITAHHWMEGKLLLDGEYTANVYSFDKNGKWQSTRMARLQFIALLDPVTEHLIVISCPEPNVVLQNRSYHRSAFVHNRLFACDNGQIREYDFQARRWHTLPVSDGNNYELFAVNGHLYAANGMGIFEIAEDGKSTRILASTRRNPPVSVLDQENLGSPVLFRGSNDSLRVCTADKIYTWRNNDWHEDSAAPPTSAQPEVFPDGILFRQIGFLEAGYQNGVIVRRKDGSFGRMSYQDVISYLPDEATMPILCLRGYQRNIANRSRLAAKASQNQKPLWEMPPNLLPQLPAALHASNLYLLENRFAAHTIINGRHDILQDKTADSDEYNAVLLCFSHDLPLPQKLFLKFTPQDARIPNWIFPTTNFLFFGSETPLDNIAPLGPGFSGKGSVGVWLMPVSQFDTATATQRQMQLDQIERAKAAATKVWKELLAKYDLNHSGVIDPEENEVALDDPVFIQTELGEIDANRNDILDPEELAYFDANRNQILDPKEQVGIDIAQHLLAESFLKNHDSNSDGVLDLHEFNNLRQFIVRVGDRRLPPVDIFFPDADHDGQVDLKEVEAFLQHLTLARLQQRQTQGQPPFLPGQPPFSNPLGNEASVDRQHLLKSAVKSCWQNPGSVTNKPPRVQGTGIIMRGATQ